MSSKSAQASRAATTARTLVGAALAAGILYLAIVGFSSIPQQIFFPEAETPSDCGVAFDSVSADIASVAAGGKKFSFDDKMRTQARLEGLREHCPTRKGDVKRLMRAHEHAWILDERRDAFFRRFPIAAASTQPHPGTTPAPTTKEPHD